MVNILSSIFAASSCIDSSFVISEAINNFKGNWYWAVLIYSNFQIIFTFWNIDSTSNNANYLCTSLNWTVLIFSHVWVILFLSNTASILNVFESVWRKTTFAAIVIKGSSAIYKLLFTNISELTIFHHIVRFKSSNSWECPTATTACLILNWSDNTLISPIPSVWSDF